MHDIAIIDYGVGNLRSIEKAFVATGASVVVSSDERVLRVARGLVLPGVGAFGACMNALIERGFDQLVYERAMKGTPLLGVCVGMQMLFEQSDEFGKHCGLDLLRGRVRRLSDELVVPHVGWNQFQQEKPHFLLANIQDQAFFYFVHSYYCEPSDYSVVIGTTKYGREFVSAVADGNLFGVQFHPEKSQKAGLQLLNNFARVVQSNV